MTAATRVRERLVDALRAAGRVRTPAVEQAMRAVPRHLFLPELPVRAAYADEAVAVQHVDGIATSSASQPSMMAIMLEQLDVRAGHRGLEIGAGTGDNAALLAHLAGPGGAVTAVDIDADLVDRAAGHLAAAGIDGVALHCADGALGHPSGAPYDRIVLTVGSADVRPEWVVQLGPGGRLLLPLTLRGSQVSVALDLGRDGVLRSRSVRSCAFIRLRGLAAGADHAVALQTPGLALQPAADAHPGSGADRPVTADEVDAALASPGPCVPLAQRLGAADVWDGFGLWLALTAPGACRVLVTDPGHADGGIAPLAPDAGTLALTGDGGLAVVIARSRQRAALRGYGPGGPTQVARLRTALDAWEGAGRPTAAGLRLTVRPRRHPAGAPEPGWGATVLTEHCRITVGWYPAGPGAHPAGPDDHPAGPGRDPATGSGNAAEPG
ncbi:MAG: methyltransferase domain-containing protein [Pseudonocardia sp.]